MDIGVIKVHSKPLGVVETTLTVGSFGFTKQMLRTFLRPLTMRPYLVFWTEK